MIKSLEDARIIDGLPSIVAEQGWAETISEALENVHKTTLLYAKNSQIYTAIDTLPEELLDVLAVNWKIDWYDPSFSIDRKRRVIETAIEIRRIMGTVRAVRLQADSINPGTYLEEWFEYLGTPGTYRLYVDISGSSDDDPIVMYDPEIMEKQLCSSKRWSAHLDSMSYMVKHALIIKEALESWKYTQPFCGTIYCGTYHEPSHLGWSENDPIITRPNPEGFLISPELTGTLPSPAIMGYTVGERMELSASAGAWNIEHEPAGVDLAGMIPATGHLGYSLEGNEKTKGMVDGYRVSSKATGGYRCGLVYSGGST